MVFEIARFVRSSRSIVMGAALGVSAASPLGCKDRGKESAAKASEDAQKLGELVAEDVAEVERGLPTGAAMFAGFFAPTATDEDKDLALVRKKLLTVRRDVPDLTRAKSSFFALTNDQGVTLRNDLNPDLMAGKNLVTIFPALAGALQGKMVETTGVFEETRVAKPADWDWIAAAPVKRADGSVGGLYVTGWTYRFFARHLQTVRQHDVAEALRGTSGKNQMPILYIGVFDGHGVYTAPLTPEVDEQALAQLHLGDKTASGPASGTLNLTEREFGWAAVRTPKLGADVGVVVMRSEL